jgi:Type IV secretion system pilin
MKKHTITISAFLLSLCLPFIFVSAQVPVTNITFQSPISGTTSVAQVLLALFKILVEIGAVAVTLAIVYAGFLFVAARGNPGELTKAKSTLYWTIIGALVLLGAQVIASVIEATIKTLGTTTPTS